MIGGSTGLGDEGGLVVERAVEGQTLRETGYERVGTSDAQRCRIEPLEDASSVSRLRPKNTEGMLTW